MIGRRAIRQASVPGAAAPASARRGAAAVEFALVVGLLFTIFLGMIEIGRAVMVMGVVSNAARTGARAAAVSSGDYTDVCTAVNATLSGADLSISPCPVTVTVNGTAVTDDASFKAAAVPGCTVAVQVRIAYSAVSWFPAGATFFLPSKQQLTETVVMRREG